MGLPPKAGPHLGVGAQRTDAETQVQATVLKAYRGQYIVSGVQDPRFMGLLSGMITAAQRQRIATALAPILG